MPEMNQHPVVFLSFQNVKADSASMMTAQLGGALQGEYMRYSPMIKGQWSSRRIHSISVLCQTLEMYYGKKVYLLLDEYDTPFISANSAAITTRSGRC